MTVAVIKTKEPGERVNMSRAGRPLLLASGQQDLAYSMALVEANRERKLAASRISELAKQAVETLLHLADKATYSQQE